MFIIQKNLFYGIDIQFSKKFWIRICFGKNNPFFRIIKCNQSVEKEIVICAAIRMSDGYIVRGHRHADAILIATKIPRYKEESHRWGDDQGFVTSRNRYVNRVEAAKIQKAAGIVSKMPEDGAYLHGECYSEDLY